MDETDLTIEYIPLPVDVLVVNGIRYSGDLFRGFASIEIGKVLEIIERKDGVIHVRQHERASERASIPQNKIETMLNTYRAKLAKAETRPIDYASCLRLSAQISLLEDLLYIAEQSAAGDTWRCPECDEINANDVPVCVCGTAKPR